MYWKNRHCVKRACTLCREWLKWQFFLVPCQNVIIECSSYRNQTKTGGQVGNPERVDSSDKLLVLGCLELIIWILHFTELYSTATNCDNWFFKNPGHHNCSTCIYLFFYFKHAIFSCSCCWTVVWAHLAPQMSVQRLWWLNTVCWSSVSWRACWTWWSMICWSLSCQQSPICV